MSDEKKQKTIKQEEKLKPKECEHHVIAGFCPICFPEEDEIIIYPWQYSSNGATK